MDLFHLFVLIANPITWISDKIFGIKQDIDLVIFGFKIVVLLFIVQFVRGRFGGGPLVTILILALGYIILFQNWMIFGPLMFVYLFIVFGFSAILFDVAITKPWQRHDMGGGGEMGGHEAHYIQGKTMGRMH